MCLPDTEGHYLCKRHNATSLDVVPFDEHPVIPPYASLNEHTDSVIRVETRQILCLMSNVLIVA